VLHAFGNAKDGAGLWGSLLLDRSGNVYDLAARSLKYYDASSKR
jgi:hypothetical protein